MINRFYPFGMKNTDEKLTKVKSEELKDAIMARKTSEEMSK